jgi:hypothetical protein
MRNCCLIPALTLVALGAVADSGRADEYLDLPAGVIHVALPPGDMKIEYTVKDKKPLLRITVGRTVVIAKAVFFGDGKSAKQMSAAEDGIHWVDAAGGGDVVTNGSITEGTGGTHTFVGGYLPVNQLKSGSVYLTTPSVLFKFGAPRKP